MTSIAARMEQAFEPARDPAAAQAMAHYMRDRFVFLGIPSPDRRAHQRDALAGVPPDRDAAMAAAHALWRRSAREYQYAACDILVRAASLLAPDDLDALGVLITTKSWWDTVDVLAISVVGPIVRDHRGAGDPVIDRWFAGTDLWLRRAAILHQQKWKAATDERRLFSFCLAAADDPDFFIRKAIGWALREYSKVAPDAVADFVAAHDGQLSALSKREALKRLARDS